MSALTFLDVLPEHLDVLVSVGAALFMVEAQSVQQLVLDGAVVKTPAVSQRQDLLSTTTPDSREAAGNGEETVRGLYQVTSKKVMIIHPFLDSMLIQSRSVLFLGLKRMQEKEEKESSPRVMTDFSRDAGATTHHSLCWVFFSGHIWIRDCRDAKFNAVVLSSELNLRYVTHNYHTERLLFSSKTSLKPFAV